VNEGYGSAANFTHSMIYVLSFESKIRKDLSKFPSVKVSDNDIIKENFLDLNLKKNKTLFSFCIEMYNFGKYQKRVPFLFVVGIMYCT
jgi:hypothetical protein